jgi:hypothetical protein
LSQQISSKKCRFLIANDKNKKNKQQIKKSRYGHLKPDITKMGLVCMGCDAGGRDTGPRLGPNTAIFTSKKAKAIPVTSRGGS